MTQELQKSVWRAFFDKLSKEKFGWQTSVQVLSEQTGANMIAERLPLNGITYEEKNDTTSIEITTGLDREDHDSHTITDPQKVAYQPDQSGDGGTLDIEDGSGTKTLISFLKEATEPFG